MSSAETTSSAPQQPRSRYKRKLRNYLLDAGLQVRYTAFIVGIAVFLTAVLGYKIYEAVRDTSKVIFMTGLVDPSMSSELQDQFRANDRIVLFGIIGFGLLLVMSMFAVGIWITHKVAGPLYSIGRVCAKVRDNQFPSNLRNLRKGDELQEFFSNFREMYEALRQRVGSDAQVLGNAISALEGQNPRSPQADEVLAELRELKRSKEQSLESN